ncbi:MAG TPA: hypothetical protein VIA18_12385, partial [Polyangia bacterium]|nr:hypothetical protein [Polyangia bacterium]
MKKWARIGLVVAKVAAWCLAVTTALAVTLVLVMLSAPGRRALLRVGLWAANGALSGHVSVRELQGDVLDRFVLIDAHLDDSEGLEIVDAKRVEIDLDWRALFHHRVHVRDVKLESTRLTLRHMKDNRLNLMALGRGQPKADEDQKPPKRHATKPSRWVMNIDHYTLDVDGAYHPPRGHEQNPLNWPRGTFAIDGAVSLVAGETKIDVWKLISDSRAPLQAHVELRGELKITSHGLPNGGALLTFGDVTVN